MVGRTTDSSSSVGPPSMEKLLARSRLLKQPGRFGGCLGDLPLAWCFPTQLASRWR
jgi:hypothetical protein